MYFVNCEITECNTMSSIKKNIQDGGQVERNVNFKYSYISFSNEKYL